MKSWTIYGGAGLIGAAVLGVAGYLTQSAGQDFDPGDPFARITSAADWVKTAETGARALDPNDRFRNLTSEAWAAAWEDRTEEQQKLSTDGFLRALSGSGGTGVKIRSPYPYASAQEHYEAWLKAAEGSGSKTTWTSFARSASSAGPPPL